MSHHFSIQENGYIIITMAGVGYTIKVKYPAATVLSDEKLTKLMTLLRGQEEDVLARWCADRAQTASYFVYDGREVKTSKAVIEPVTILGSQGVFRASTKYRQGACQVDQALASFAEHVVRRISVVSATDLYIIYTNVLITEYLGIIRSPLMSLNDLVEECTASQGISCFAN